MAQSSATNPGLPAAPSPAASSIEEIKLRALLARMSDAWERGDGDSYISAFSDDADYVVFDGTHLHGKQDIAAAHAPLWTNALKGAQLLTIGLTIRFVTPDVALLHSRGAVQKWYERRPAKSAVSVQSMVAVRSNGAWQITAFYNTRYQPFAQSLVGKVVMRLTRHLNASTTTH
jgi:uncharacterized protein (TIGR02246 family)